MNDHIDIKNSLEMVLADLGGKSDEELKEILDDLCSLEAELSFKRRVLHGKIDIIRAELTERLKNKRIKGEPIINVKDIDKLSEILAKGGKPASRRSKEYS